MSAAAAFRYAAEVAGAGFKSLLRAVALTSLMDDYVHRGHENEDTRRSYGLYIS